MAVSVRGCLARDLVKKSNIELVKGADRATTADAAARFTHSGTARA